MSRLGARILEDIGVEALILLHLHYIIIIKCTKDLPQILTPCEDSSLSLSCSHALMLSCSRALVVVTRTLETARLLPDQKLLTLPAAVGGAPLSSPSTPHYALSASGGDTDPSRTAPLSISHRLVEGS